jgi:hypothetical protein
MIRFNERPSIDPDNPELDYSLPRLSERLAKLGPSASQGARSEPIGSCAMSRPASLAPKDEPAKHRPDLDWRAALLGVAARFATVAGAVAVVALLVVIMKPSSRQSVASSPPSDTTGSTSQSNQGDVKSKPELAELKALLASPPSQPASQPATHEQSEQLLQRFLQWREKADTTEASGSSAQPR